MSEHSWTKRLRTFLYAGWRRRTDGTSRKVWYRTEIPVGETFRRPYEPSSIDRDIFDELWTEISDSLDIPPELLRPEDGFYADLVAARWLPITIENLEDAMHARQDSLGQGEQEMSITTVDDYVRVFATKMRDHREGGPRTRR